jgi:hypothetical protein
MSYGASGGVPVADEKTSSRKITTLCTGFAVVNERVEASEPEQYLHDEKAGSHVDSANTTFRMTRGRSDCL